MPTYAYKCPSCTSLFDVIKPMAELDRLEECPACCGFANSGSRLIQAANIDRTAAAGWNGQTFHPALGCYTRSDQHARKIAKARGLEEVGTESPDKIHKHFEAQRETVRDQRWAEADRVKVYE